MNYTDEEIKSVIMNEFDYSNIIATEEGVMYLVKHFDQVFNQFLKLAKEDERKNEKLNYEFQIFTYKAWLEKFKVNITFNTYNFISCDNYASFAEIANKGQLKNIKSLEIVMELNYQRGRGNNLEEHENKFVVNFEPYKITFVRNSNHKEDIMDQIENMINQILKEFPSANTIFCSK